MDECKPLFAGDYAAALGSRTWRITHSHDIVPSVPIRVMGRGLHSFPFQLNLSTSMHRITQLNS